MCIGTLPVEVQRVPRVRTNLRDPLRHLWADKEFTAQFLHHRGTLGSPGVFSRRVLASHSFRVRLLPRYWVHLPHCGRLPCPCRPSMRGAYRRQRGHCVRVLPCCLLWSRLLRVFCRLGIVVVCTSPRFRWLPVLGLHGVSMGRLRSTACSPWPLVYSGLDIGDEFLGTDQMAVVHVPAVRRTL